jgi:deazaflavin-dependent oxidoreductase (nitroreductase family)
MDEFRANSRKIGGDFEGVPMVIVLHTGAKPGSVRSAPLTFLANGDDVVIFGTKGRSPTHPAWHHNLIAKPDTVIELGSETLAVLGLERRSF